MRKEGITTSSRPALRPIHPFPARMAASIAFDELRHKRRPLRVLDPMAGSGTTLVVAKSQGHHAIGFDTDPMAVLLARAWCLDVKEDVVRSLSARVLEQARTMSKGIPLRDAYPCPKEDHETRRFVRYWFDATNRRQLTALSRPILRERNAQLRTLLWCAFSRMIITKQASVSLAMDLAHSRPHRVRKRSDIRPFSKFLTAVEAVLAAATFKDKTGQGKVDIRSADARKLPLPSGSIDLVITSPPYLNAIDYLRCHKFTLVWMGYPVSELRDLRASNIGSEVGLHTCEEGDLNRIIKQMTAHKNLPPRYQGVLKRYVTDMHAVIREIARVLVPGGRATFVVGNSTLRGVFVKNSRAISLLGQKHGLNRLSVWTRNLPNSRRYLPPPSNGKSTIGNRMRTEIVITLRKPLKQGKSRGK